jgi:hypothetical protein
MNAVLALEDGTFYKGVSAGAAGQTEGEVVFNTSMSGYQEVLTDPSYAGQIVTMTAPQIGNYGVAETDVESEKPQVAGFVMRDPSPVSSNWRSQGTLGDYLAANAPTMGVYVGGVVATDITSWANLQLCYALPRLDYSTGCIPRRAYKVNVASVPVSYRTGKIMKNPADPGLGTGLDLKKLENYVHRESSLTSARPPN